MLKQNEISERLVESLRNEAENEVVQDVRIGLGFCAVQLKSGSIGMSAILRHEIESGCTVFHQAGTLAERPLSELLEMLLVSGSVVKRALGLAAANAVLSGHQPVNPDRRDTIELLNLKKDDRAAMVGFFKPLFPKIKRITPFLTVIERDLSSGEAVSLEDGKKALKECDVALISATTISNDTLEQTLNLLGEPRRVTLLGPSTPLKKEIFSGTPVNHLAGSLVKEPEKILQIVSEGGGTMVMRPYLDFVNLIF